MKPEEIQIGKTYRVLIRHKEDEKNDYSIGDTYWGLCSGKTDDGRVVIDDNKASWCELAKDVLCECQPELDEDGEQTKTPSFLKNYFLGFVCGIVAGSGIACAILAAIGKIR